MYKVAIIGDGYTAVELLRLISGHDQMQVEYVLSLENIGREFAHIYPQLLGYSDIVCSPSDINILKGNCDAAFLALPHGQSVPIAKQLLEWGIKCVDLGADFRLKDVKVYEEYYHIEHQAQDLLARAVYGIPELYRDQILKTDLVANPGCYPTGAIVPLAPLLEAGLIKTDYIIIDSKSGVTGAGRELRASSHFCEVHNGIRAYGIGTHRHGPEIAQELGFCAGMEVGMRFTPHLVPMSRGILSTIYVNLNRGIRGENVRDCLREKYQDEPFVKILPDGFMPDTNWVKGSNNVHIGFQIDEHRGNMVLVSALDNLTKGASGQAIQNMNLILGIEETKGLKMPGLHP